MFRYLCLMIRKGKTVDFASALLICVEVVMLLNRLRSGIFLHFCFLDILVDDD